MAIASCVSMFYLDKAVQIFDSLCRCRVALCYSVYNAVLDACARATVLWNPSTPLADLNINALASLSGSGMCPFSLQAPQPSINVSRRRDLAPFSRANWSEAVRLIGLAIDEGVVSRDLLAPLDKQSKDSATLVLDASVMGLGYSALLLASHSLCKHNPGIQVCLSPACIGGSSSAIFPLASLRAARYLSGSTCQSPTLTSLCRRRRHHYLHLQQQQHHHFSNMLLPFAPRAPPSLPSSRSFTAIASFVLLLLPLLLPPTLSSHSSAIRIIHIGQAPIDGRRSTPCIVIAVAAAAAVAAVAAVVAAAVIVIHQPSPIQPPYPFTAPSRWACSSGATAHRPPVKKCNTLRRYARACGMVILMEKEGAARE
jgi:hypothetical protein